MAEPASNYKSAEFFLDRSRRVASKVTALSRKGDLDNVETKELADAISIASVYGALGVGYAILARIDDSNVDT